MAIMDIFTNSNNYNNKTSIFNYWQVYILISKVVYMSGIDPAPGIIAP